MKNNLTLLHPSLQQPRFTAWLTVVVTALASVFFATSALATSAVWTGSANALWSDTNNWSGLPVTVPGSNELATFNATSANTAINLTGGITVASNLFDTISAAAYTIGTGGAGAQTLTLSAPGAITLNSTVTNNQLFNANLSLGTSTNFAKAFSIANNSTTAGLTLAGSISTAVTGTNTITFGGAGTTTVNGQISNGSGAISLVKASATGTVILANSNNFLGVSFAGGVGAGDNGAIRVTHSDALTGATITMPGQNATTQTIELANNITLTNRINSNSRDAGRPMIRNVSGTNTFSGTYIATATGGGITFESTGGKINMTGGLITTNAISTRGLQLQGTAAGEITHFLGSAFIGAVTKTGSGSWTLSNSNNYAGGTIINGGTLSSAHPTSLGTGTITMAGTSNATLNIATDGADFANAVTAGSSTTWALSSDVKTGSAGINHTLGAFTIGSGTPALQMNIIRGPNVLSGSPRITLGVLTLSGGLGGTTIINPTTADITIPSVTSTSGNKTLQLDGTSTGNQITGVIANGANLIPLVKSGASTWTLSGANTYTGNTTVSNGSLALTGSGAILSTNITVVSGGTLDLSGVSFTLAAHQILSGNGAINGNFSDSTGSQILPAGASTVGKLTFNNTLTLAGGDTVKFDFATGTNDTIAVGTLTPSGVTAINLASLPPGGLANGSYTLFEATTLNGTTNNFTITGAPSPSRQSFGIVYDTASSPKRVLLSVTGSAATLLWRGIASAWDITTSLNWTNTGTAANDVFFDGDNVNFTDLGTATSPVLNVTVQPSSATFNAAGNYTLSGTGRISGGGAFTKSGAGTVTILTTNDYSGASAINGGTVSVDGVANGGAASALGAASSASANLSFNGGALQITGAGSSSDRGATLNAGGATLDVTNAAATLTVNGAVVGGGGLTKIGNGTLALGGVNTYSGPTVVNVGALNTAGGNAIGDLSAVTLADAAGVSLNLGANEGVGSLAGGGASGGNVNLNANRLFIGANNANTTYAGIIGGTGGINKVGNGTLTLDTAHSFTGSIFGNRGTLVLSNATVSLTAYVSIGQDTNDNATLTLKDSAQFTTTSDLNAGDLSASVGTINIQDNAQVTVNAVFVGSANAAGSTASGVINQTGGTFTEQNAGVGFFSIGGRGPSAGGVGVYNISGGTMTAAAGIRVGSQGTGTLNVSNTAVVNANGGFNTARLAGSTGTANFNGGTVNTLNFASSTGVNATNNFNGSAISPTVATTTFLQGLSRANIRTGGLILNDNNLNLTINQALLHSDITGDNATDGGLSKSGSGTLTLTAASTYTGPTAITAGALVVTGSLGTNTVTVDSGASLSGNGLLNGPTVVNGTITPGSAIGVLTISNSLTLSPSVNGTAVFSFGPGTNSTIKVSGALNVPNTTTVNLNFINAVPPVGTNTLIRYGSISGFGNLTNLPTSPRYTFKLINDTVAKEVKLVVTGVPANLVWLGDGVLNYWDNTGSYSNWLNGVNPDYFYDGDIVTFNNNGSNNLPVSLQNNVFPASVTVNANQDYELGGTGALASPGSLTKSGTGALILSTSNSFAGSAVINAGIVQVGNGSTTGTLVASNITNSATLAFNRSDALAIGATISGGGLVVQSGLGSAALTASNSYTGTTLVTNGVLFPRNSSALGSPVAGVVATNAGQLYIDQNIDIADEPLALGGAALRKGGGGVTTWGGPVTLAADTTIQVDGNATLNFTNAAGVTGTAVSLTVQGDGGSAGTIAGSLALGTGGLTKGGSGTWTLGTNNNFTGLTAVNAGTLRISDNTVGNPASFTANQVTLGGGTLTATTNVSFVGGNVGFTVTGTTGGFGVEAGATLTISNDITGSGTLTKFGPGTLALVGPNTFSGTLNLDSFINTGNDGAVLVTTSNALATVASPIYSRNNNGGISTLQLSGGFGIAQGFVTSCRNSGVAWVQNLAGNNKLLGLIQVEVGGGTLPFQSDAGQLEIANNIQYIGTSTNGRIYQFGGAGNTLVSGVILNGDNTAPVSVSKTGAGTLTLSAANTYLGATTINNGLLSLTGSISSTGAVSVVGGALGGTGTITDNVSVGAAGAIAPGVGGIGTLTVNGNLALSGGLTIDVNKSASPTNDFISVSGTLANSGTGTVTVSNLGPALVVGNSFKLFSQPVVNGGTMIVTGGLGAGLGWTNNLAVDGSVAVIAVSTVATNPTNLVSSVSGTTLSLSWPSDHLGWFLQTQTNSRSIGLKPQTNFWFDVTGSQLITNTSITIERTNPTVFFRLRSP